MKPCLLTLCLVAGASVFGAETNQPPYLDPGKPVETRDALTRSIESKKGGDKIELSVYNNGRTRKVNVTLGSAPEAL